MKNQVKEEDGGGLLREAPAKGTNWQRGACMVDLWAEEEKKKESGRLAKIHSRASVVLTVPIFRPACSSQ